MKSARSVLRPFKKLRGGIHLDHQKNAENFETVIMPPPEKVFIPMSQHIGAHAAACVKKGDSVYVGTVIGEAAGAVRDGEARCKDVAVGEHRRQDGLRCVEDRR